MSQPYSYAEAKSALITLLTRDIELHEAKCFGDLGAGFDDFDTRLPRNSEHEFDKLFFAFEFWSGWLDSAEHDWFFYEPIHEADWPVLAKEVISNLQIDRATENPILLKHFSPQPRGQSLFAKVRALFQNEGK